MKPRYEAVTVAAAAMAVMSFNQPALAIPSNNCGRIERALQADEEALGACLRGGGSCSWIKAAADT